VVDGSGNGAGTTILMLSREAVDRVRRTLHVADAVRILAREARLQGTAVAPRFCTSIDAWGDVSRVEREYLWHASRVKGEGFFTKNVRRFSIPLSRWLLRQQVTATQVTIAGFALSIVAGLEFLRGEYWFGIAGALAYWASLVLDRSGEQVAGATLTDSRRAPGWIRSVTISRTSSFWVGLSARAITRQR
jgi:hypothetical protein